MLAIAATVLSTANTAATANAAATAVDFSMASQRTTLITGAKGSYTTTQETYYSQNITLKAGHMIFTDIDKTPLRMPQGEYAITHFIGDIVFADTHEPVPLSEVYCHHWTAVSSTHKNLSLIHI